MVVCRSGQRASYATRILVQNGFRARNLSGGTLARTMRLGDAGETRMPCEAVESARHA